MTILNNLRSCSLAALVVGMTFGSAQAESVTEIEWWHPFGPEGIGAVVQELVDQFNLENPEFLIRSVNKGGYGATMNATVAAYRAGEQPGLVLSLARDAPTLMTSDAIYPVQKLLSDNGYDVDWSRFIVPALAMLSNEDGVASLPFNSSTPILWYNVDAFEQAGVTTVPQTWDEVGDAARKLKSIGYDCALSSEWPNWVNLDSYAMIQNIEVATNNNGMDGWDTEFTFNEQPQYIAHIQRLKDWLDEGIYTYAGRTSSSNVFISGECAMSFLSSAAYLGIESGADFEFSSTFLPIEADNDDPKNSLIGGGTIFVMSGLSDEENAGAAKFLNFLMQTPQQINWHKQTHYVPISLDAYDQLKAEGYYEENPTQETGLLQLNRGGEPGLLNRGFRFGMASQVYTTLNEELERVWAGEKEVQEAMDDAAQRSTDIVARFVRTIGQ